MSHPDLAELLNRLRQPFNVNGAAQAAAMAALEDSEHLGRSVRLNREGVEQVAAGLDALGLEYIPTRANFVCLDAAGSAHEVYEGLLREGVIVRPLAAYGMLRHLRVSVGLERDNSRLLAALGRVLRRLHRKAG